MRALFTGFLVCLLGGFDGATAAEPSRKQTPEAVEHAISREIILPAWMKELQGEAEISIGHLSYSGYEFNRIRIPMRLSAEKLATTGSGQLGDAGELSFQWRHSFDGESNVLSVAAKRIQFSDLPLFSGKASGLFDLALDIVGDGNSLHQILSNANGVLAVDVDRGTLASNDLERAGSDLLSYFVAGLNPFATRETATRFRCAKARLNVVSGKVRANRIAGLQTEQFTMLCGGELDIGSEQATLLCQPHQHFEFVPDGLSVVESIAVDGTFSSPKMVVNKLGILERGASLGAGITGLGLNQIGGLLRRADNDAMAACEIELLD